MIHNYDSIEYLVKVRNPLHYSGTIITERFKGKLVNQNSGNFYFDIHGGSAVIIIPHSEIEWMAPTKEGWPLRGGILDD